MAELISPRLKAQIIELLGWTPRSWRKVEGGYTAAARFVVEDGLASAFVKIATNPVTVAHMRREIAVYGVIDSTLRPALHGACAEGDQPFLIIDDLSEATWPPPWTDGRVQAALDTITRLHSHPAPLKPFAEVHGAEPPGWEMVAADRSAFLSLGLATPEWLDRALPALLEAEAACQTAGDAPVHLDIRSDNMCFVDGCALLIDWGEACLANPKIDLGAWLPSLAYEGGPPPSAILPNEPEVAAWLSGYFAAHAGLAPIPSAPFVRRVQKQQLSTALPWICEELSLGRPLG